MSLEVIPDIIQRRAAIALLQHEYTIKKALLETAFEAFIAKRKLKEDSSFSLIIRSLTAKETVIEGLRPTDPVYLLKNLYHRKEGVPEDQQRLVYEGKQLEDNDKLSSYNLKGNEKVFCVLRLRGGMYADENARYDNDLSNMINYLQTQIIGLERTISMLHQYTME